MTPCPCLAARMVRCARAATIAATSRLHKCDGGAKPSLTAAEPLALKVRRGLRHGPCRGRPWTPPFRMPSAAAGLLRWRSSRPSSSTTRASWPSGGWRRSSSCRSPCPCRASVRHRPGAAPQLVRRDPRQRFHASVGGGPRRLGRPRRRVVRPRPPPREPEGRLRTGLPIRVALPTGLPAAVRRHGCVRAAGGLSRLVCPLERLVLFRPVPRGGPSRPRLHRLRPPSGLHEPRLWPERAVHGGPDDAGARPPRPAARPRRAVFRPPRLQTAFRDAGAAAVAGQRTVDGTRFLRGDGDRHLPRLSRAVRDRAVDRFPALLELHQPPHSRGRDRRSRSQRQCLRRGAASGRVDRHGLDGAGHRLARGSGRRPAALAGRSHRSFVPPRALPPRRSCRPTSRSTTSCPSCLRCFSSGSLPRSGRARRS